MSPAEALLAFSLAFAISLVTVPAGVSGAVFLLPAQISVLGLPSPAVTPTNLLYNVVATPGAIVRFQRTGQVRTDLLRPLVLGTAPGVAIGAALRVTVGSSAEVFRLLVAGLLATLGARLLINNMPPSRPSRVDLPRRLLLLMGLGTGVVGGFFGIGGGSVLAPLLAVIGFGLIDVAGVALAVTFITSIVGVALFCLLALLGQPEAAPQWPVGLALGLGGLAGGYLGARWQPRASEQLLRRLLGGLAVTIGAGYVVSTFMS